MKGGKPTLYLACLSVATTVAVVAAPSVRAAPTAPVHASAAGLRGHEQATSTETGAQPAARHELRLGQRKGSHARDYALVTAAVLFGFVVLGLWGDIAIGALIVAICGVGAGVASLAGKARSRVRLNLRRPRVGSLLTSEATTAPAQHAAHPDRDPSSLAR